MKDPFKKKLAENMKLLQDGNHPPWVLDKLVEFLEGVANAEKDEEKKTQYVMYLNIFSYIQQFYNMLHDETDNAVQDRFGLGEKVKEMEKTITELKRNQIFFENSTKETLNKLEKNLLKLTKERLK